MSSFGKLGTCYKAEVHLKFLHFLLRKMELKFVIITIKGEGNLFVKVFNKILSRIAFISLHAFEVKYPSWTFYSLPETLFWWTHYSFQVGQSLGDWCYNLSSTAPFLAFRSTLSPDGPITGWSVLQSFSDNI